MNIEKSQWSSEGQNIHLSVPFTKVNRETRTVSGFATLDNVDQTGDVVTAEASLKAFESFRGNLREMHQPLAVGKVVSFKPETFYDVKSKEFYNGVYVTSYISKGAQDTWEKVLDGTLTGFSIGGKIKESDNEMNKVTGQTVRFIKEYDLVELSIVDSPANEMCNIVSIEKMNGQLIFKGMAADVVTENIFYCEESDSVFISTEKTYVSPVTGKDAALIGWVESSDTNKSKEIDKILASFQKSRVSLPATQTIAKQANVQGGNEVEKLNVKAEDSAVVEATPVAEAPAVEAIVEETVVASDAPVVEDAPAADSAEDADSASVDVFKSVDALPADTAVENEEPDFAKMLVDLKGFFADTLSKATEANAVQVSEIKETVETFSKGVNAQITELAEKHSALSAAVSEIKGTIDGVQKRVDAVEGDTAIKKSSDLGGSEVLAKNKSKWNGSFLGSVNEIFN
jgi:Putative phage serine protease XkdF